jgi:hypothetical protein
MDLFKIAWDGVDWTDLGQDMNRRRDLVNAVMKLRIS